MARRISTLVAATLFLLTAACGTTDEKAGDTTAKQDDPSSSEAETDDPSSTTDAATGDAGGTEGASSEFCATADELGSLAADVGKDDYDGYIRAIEDAADVFETYVDLLPDDLKGDGRLLVDAIEQSAADLEQIKDDPDVEEKFDTVFEPLKTPEITAARESTTAYYQETCPEEGT